MANLRSVQSASTGATRLSTPPFTPDSKTLRLTPPITPDGRTRFLDQPITIPDVRALLGSGLQTVRAVSLAIGITATLLGLVLPATSEAASTNCINVLGRDAYWSRFQEVYAPVARAGWLDDAFEASDFTVDGVPTIGSLMIWAPRYGGATWAGHVGVVEVVARDGTVTVKHENWPRGSGEHLDEFTVLPGHRFVHPRQPAPGSPDGFASYPDEAERIMAVTGGVLVARGQDPVAPD